MKFTSLLVLLIGINQCSCSLHNSVSRIGRTPHLTGAVSVPFIAKRTACHRVHAHHTRESCSCF